MIAPVADPQLKSWVQNPLGLLQLYLSKKNLKCIEPSDIVQYGKF